MATASPSTENVPFGWIPSELTERRQWVVWRKEPSRGSKPKKVPYTPGTGRRADPTDPDTWRSFQDAEQALVSGQWDGLGYVLSSDDPFVGIDLDKCRDSETGELTHLAREWIARLNSYTEVSPSGTGIRIFVRGTLPDAGRRDAKRGVELYTAEHYLSVTGHGVPGTLRTIENRDAAVRALFADVFGDGSATPPPHPRPRAGARPRSHQPTGEQLSQEDEQLIASASAAANGDKFSRLWDGDWQIAGEYPSQSEADLALCALLAYHTGCDAERMDRLFRHSGLFRPERWDGDGRRTYGERTIDRAVTTSRNVRRDSSNQLVHVYSWQRQAETQAQRDAYLRTVVSEMAGKVRACLDRREPNRVLVVAIPPGVGKSHGIAQLGIYDYSLGWVAERHDMVEHVASLRPPYYRHIQACTAENCPAADLHTLLASQGRNTWSVHRQHDCDYRRQFDGEGSAVYMLPHVRSSYPVGHKDGIVVDELDVAKWLPEREVTWRRLRRVVVAFERESTAARLMRAVEELLDDADRQRQRDGQAFTGWQGRELLDRLDTLCHGQLAQWVEEVRQDQDLMTELPWADVDLTDLRAAKEALSTEPPVVLPHVARALHTELPKWQAGGDWNARLRVGKASDGTGDWALYLSEPLQFTPAESGDLPPLVILDATANLDLYRQLFRTEQVQVWSPATVTPPPNMRHIAIRTKGKRYGSISLEARNGRALRRAIAEVAHILRRLDPEGTLRAANRVGLITFKDVEQRMAEALGIAYQTCTGHFWAMRGSNQLEHCDILLVVGTPTPNLDSVVRMARALYGDDPTAIVTDSEDIDGHQRYKDPRLQGLVEYLVFAELTQMAHRNRPLRFGGRTVVTFCDGEVGFLPPTETYTHLPERLDKSGEPARNTKRCERDERCARAAGELLAEGKPLTVAELARRAGVGYGHATDWLQRYRAGKVTPQPLC